MKISIITITLNSRKYLEETITSVLSQDHQNLEYIFVDGGSTDGTLEIIKKYAENDPRIRWSSESDRGISDAMNKGVAMATGDVIAHLHSDDSYPDTGILSFVADQFSSRPDALWLTGGEQIVDDTGKILREIPVRNYSYRKLIRSNFILHAATFVRRTAFLEAGSFSVSRKYAMDYDLWLRLGALGAPITVDKILACFRFHGGSLSTAETEKAFAEELAIRKDFFCGRPIRFFFHYLYYLVKKKRNRMFVQRLLNP
ncbi:MAG: glycosyltransferase [Deltaproteobacteria bacterium]|nr:glycosyltransferase [Deltaproteobacteria bacterium]